MPPAPAPAPPASSVAVRPLGVALLICLAAVVLTAVLSPTETGGWYAALERPPVRIPPLVLMLLAIGYYPIFGLLLYRTQILPALGRLRPVMFGLLVAAMALQVAWNSLLLGVEQLEMGLVANGVLAGLLGTLWALHVAKDRMGALLLLPYLLLALHDVHWSWALIDLNPR
jgi:tryptophan-rich sensory protein